MTMLFSKGGSVSKIAKFWFALKNWPDNTYHMYILKINQIPDQIHEQVDLDVPLDPQDGIERIQTTNSDSPCAISMLLSHYF